MDLAAGKCPLVDAPPMKTAIPSHVHTSFGKYRSRADKTAKLNDSFPVTSLAFAGTYPAV
jgi:hypothetical protein